MGSGGGRGGRFALVACAGLLLACASLAAAGEAEVAPGGDDLDVVTASAEEGSCVPSDTVMCLQDGRYEVTVEFVVDEAATPASARVVKSGSRPIGTRDSGLFYFFDPKNWELLLKVLDGCWYNQHHWVFASAATDVGYTITVRDTVLSDEEGVTNMKVYPNAPGAPAPALTDVGAFPDACTASAA